MEEIMKLSSAVAMRVSNLLRERNMSQYRLEKGFNLTIAQFFDDPIFEREDLEIY